MVTDVTALLEEAKRHQLNTFSIGEVHICSGCGESWPCLTRRLADALDEQSRELGDDTDDAEYIDALRRQIHECQVALGMTCDSTGEPGCEDKMFLVAKECERVVRELAEARKDRAMFIEYLNFLSDKGRSAFSLAFAHGWRVSDKDYRRGKQFRTDLRLIEEDSIVSDAAMKQAPK